MKYAAYCIHSWIQATPNIICATLLCIVYLICGCLLRFIGCAYILSHFHYIINITIYLHCISPCFPDLCLHYGMRVFHDMTLRVSVIDHCSLTHIVLCTDMRTLIFCLLWTWVCFLPSRKYSCSCVKQFPKVQSCL